MEVGCHSSSSSSFRNSAASLGFVHNDSTVKCVGLLGHENKWILLWGDCVHFGQLSGVSGSTLDR